MSVLAIHARTVLDRLTLDEVALWAGVLTAELLAVGIYFTATGAQSTTLRYVLYPFVWINLGLWAALHVRPRPAGRRTQLVAGGVALGYFLVLTWFAGLFGTATGDGAVGLDVTFASPGLGPIVGYFGTVVYVVAVPYLVVGYLTLSYLVYVAALDASRAALPGVLGLASCVGCAFPIVATIVAGVAGGSSAVVATIYTHSMDLSTVAFVLAFALLYWRPGFE